MKAVVDRVVQYPHRYQLRNVNTGEVLGTFDLEPITGTISVVGTKIDKELFDSIASDISARLVSNGGDAKDNVITYTMASNRSNIASGEKLSVSFGKIAKYFNDLKAIAFSGDRADIGLGNVDNTSDANKPVSNATQQALNLKANASDVYTKTETDGLLNNKANKNDVYSKTKTDELLNNKANKSDVYTKSETDGLLNNKANASETDNKINKPLYNLGAYDTISGNVITRQTGYVNGKDYLSKTISKNGVNNPYLTIDNIYVDYIENIIGNCNRVDTNSWWNSTFSQVTISYDSTYKFLVIMLPNGATDTSSLNNIYVQYKLTTPYTEEIIEGQPLITLDQQGSQWLRDEWEKGLNVWDEQWEVGGFYWASGEPLDDNSRYRSKSFSRIKPSTNYFISAPNTINILFYDSSKNYIKYEEHDNTSFVTPNNAYYFKICNKYANVYNNDIMLNEGDHPYPYQPYNSKAHITNYEADYLKEESLKSANLLDNSLLNKTAGTDNFTAYGIPFVLEAGTYTISLNGSTTSITIALQNASGADLFTPVTFDNNGSQTFTISEKSTKLFLYNVAWSSANYNIMLNKGTKALPYQPYNQNKHITNNEADFLKNEHDRSANLFDKDNGFVGDINANTGEFREVNTDFISSDYIEIKPNTTYSNNLKIKSFGTTGLAFYDSNKTYISGIVNNSSVYNKFTTPSNAKYLRLSIDKSYSQPYDDINNIMLNEGSEPLPYQPYEGKVVHEKGLESASVFTKIGNKTNFSFDSGSYLVLANNGMVTVTGADPLNVGSSANKKYLGVFMVTIAEYDGGQSLRVNTEQVFFADYVSGTISGSRFTIYKLN